MEQRSNGARMDENIFVWMAIGCVIELNNQEKESYSKQRNSPNPTAQKRECFN